MNSAFRQFRTSTIAVAGSIAILGLPAIGLGEDVGQKYVTDQIEEVEGLADDSWKQDLTDQIESIEDCVVASIGDAVSNDADEEDKLTATVECKDGRVFQASQPDEFLPFTFNACEGGASGC